MWSLDSLRGRIGGHRLQVGLAGHRLFVAPGNSKQTDRCHALPLHPAPSAATPPWRPALQALAEELANYRNPQRGSGLRPRRVDLVLANGLVRWKVIDLPPGLRKPADRQAVAAHHIRNSLSSDVDHWHVELVGQPAGWPIPACAVDDRLLDEFHAMCIAAKVKPGIVQPYFSAAFDYWRAQLTGDNFWFAVQDGDSTSLGLVSGGRWVGINSRPSHGNWHEQLPSMQAQLAIPAGIDGQDWPLHVVAVDEQLPSGLAGTGARVLTPPSNWHPAAVSCRMAFGI